MNSIHGRLADIVPASCVDGPGNRFVVFLQGCGFDCLACHNPQTITRHANAGRRIEVDALLDEVRAAAPFLSGVTVSGGEPTLQWPFVVEFFTRLKGAPDLHQLGTLLDTNGDAEPEAWRALEPVMDGAMVDLKALDPALHRALTGRPNDRVLASIERLAAIGRLHEVRLLLIPGVNDQPERLARTAKWLLGVDPGIAIRLNGFHRHGTRRGARHFPDAGGDSLAAAVRVLAGAGVRADRITVSGLH